MFVPRERLSSETMRRVHREPHPIEPPATRRERPTSLPVDLLGGLLFATLVVVVIVLALSFNAAIRETVDYVRSFFS